MGKKLPKFLKHKIKQNIDAQNIMKTFKFRLLLKGLFK